MTHLYLLRHGIAVERGACAFADEQRPLTEEGERKVRRVARGLRALELGLDAIVTSPLVRAAKTADIVAEVLGRPGLVETAPELSADRDAASIRDWLRGRGEGRLMVVGHNPSLSDLLSLLVLGRAELPIAELRKAGVAALRAGDGETWRLDWLARPRLLRLRDE